MPKIFSSILKQKRSTIFVVFLAFILFFSFATNVSVAYADCNSGSSAFSYCRCENGKCNLYTSASLKINLLGLTGGDECHVDGDCAGGTVSNLGPGPDNAGDADFGWNIFKSIPVAISRFVLWTSWVLASLASLLFKYIFDLTQSMKITTDNIFREQWILVRDLANMIVVLGFVVVGVATSLRIQEYAAKKLLGRLVAVALLINFSGLFCGLIIDASNIIFRNLAGASGQSGTAIVDAIAKGGQAKMTKEFVMNNVLLFMNIAAMHAATYIAVMITFLYMAVLLIIRYAVLAMLYILSPIAFAFWVYPASRKLATDWWHKLLKWAFVGVAGVFFLTVAANIMSQTGAMTTANTIAGVANLNVKLFVGLIFMIVGFRMTSKSDGIAALAATAVMGAVTGGAGLAARAGGAALKGTGIAGAAQRAGQNLKDRATTVGEKYGVIKKGTTEQNKAERLKEPMSRLDNITDNSTLAKIAEQRTYGNANRAAEKAAAAKILASRNAFNAIDPNKRDSVAKYAQSFGIAKETFTKGSPEVGAGATDAEARQSFFQGKADDYLKTGSAKTKEDAMQLAKKNHPTPAAGSTELKQAHQELRQRRILESAVGVSPVSDRDIENKLIGDRRTELFKAGKTAPEVDKEMRRVSFTDADRVVAKESLSADKFKRAVQKLPPNKVAELPEEAMVPEVVKHMNENQVVGILRNGSPKTTTAFATAAENHIKTEKASGSDTRIAEATEYQKMVIRATKRATWQEDEEKTGKKSRSEEPKIVSGSGSSGEKTKYSRKWK